MRFSCVLLLLLILRASDAYLPVIMMHGVGSDAGEMNEIAKMISQHHPNTTVTSLPLFENSPAAWDHPLQTQVDGVIDAIRKLVAGDPEGYKDGYHLVCKSQGALTCRCVIEQMEDHNVQNFVSLAGPQLGVFGPDYFNGLKKYGLPEWFVEATEDSMWLVAYNQLGQRISVGNMWRDWRHLDSFAKHDVFIPKFTTEATSAMKSNFVRLKRAVFCVGSGPPYDGGIEPWQTGVWGSFDDEGRMVNMTDQLFYKSDSFGLRTLDESGRLNLTIVPNVSHGDWTGNDDIIETYVLPHCT